MISSHDTPLKVAILGASGIGRHHARIFSSLGAEVVAVLGSTFKNAEKAAKDLNLSFGINARPFENIDEILDEPIDAVSICTPPSVHLSQVLASFDRKLPVFCEKPLFWNHSIDSKTIEQGLELIRCHPSRQLFVNTSNSVFIDTLKGSLPKPEDVKRFFFRFHTNGLFQGMDIAWDLLPHGFSALSRFLGKKNIELFNWEHSQNSFRCAFTYGQCSVEFDFQEDPGGNKDLSLGINDSTYKRIQEGSEDTYRVYLKNTATGRCYEMKDPFRIFISNFIHYCNQDVTCRQDEFSAAAWNLQLMSECLKPIATYKG